MAPTAASPLDFEAAEHAFARVKAKLEALDATALAAINVDIVSATSIVLGVAPRILAYRDRMAALPEFDVQNVDNLVDYAKAAWFAYTTNLPEPEPADASRLLDETVALRAKLLMWAGPLVGSGKFDEKAVQRIREGAGNRDLPSDLVALVALYRANWDAVKGICDVTEQDLTRASELGPAVFAMVSRRENQASGVINDGSLRVRRAWTLLDRAYNQCRRALAYLRADEGDVDDIAPSLRRNPGPRGAVQVVQPPTVPAPIMNPPVTPAEPQLGGDAGPFVAPKS